MTASAEERTMQQSCLEQERGGYTPTQEKWEDVSRTADSNFGVTNQEFGRILELFALPTGVPDIMSHSLSRIETWYICDETRNNETGELLSRMIMRYDCNLGIIRGGSDCGGCYEEEERRKRRRRKEYGNDGDPDGNIDIYRYIKRKSNIEKEEESEINITLNDAIFVVTIISRVMSSSGIYLSTNRETVHDAVEELNSILQSSYDAQVAAKVFCLSWESASEKREKVKILLKGMFELHNNSKLCELIYSFHQGSISEKLKALCKLGIWQMACIAADEETTRLVKRYGDKTWGNRESKRFEETMIAVDIILLLSSILGISLSPGAKAMTDTVKEAQFLLNSSDNMRNVFKAFCKTWKMASRDKDKFKAFVKFALTIFKDGALWTLIMSLFQEMSYFEKLIVCTKLVALLVAAGFSGRAVFVARGVLVVGQAISLARRMCDLYRTTFVHT